MNTIGHQGKSWCRHRMQWLAVMIIVLVLSGCAERGGEVQQGDEVTAGLGHETIMQQAADKAERASGYALNMKLEQEAASVNGRTETYDLSSEGVVELQPLAVRQVIETVNNEETAKLDTILTQDGYYILDEIYEEGWRQLPNEQVATIRDTLSDYQIAPHKQLARLQEFAGENFVMKQEQGLRVLQFEGDGSDPVALSLMEDLLRSTLTGGELSAEMRESLVIDRLQYRLAIDAATGYPAEMTALSDFAIALDADEPLQIHQRFEVRYADWGTAEPIEVPEEARNAPEFEMPTAEELEEWERLERELQDEAGE